jgi:glycosyltransferase involved in cell wall biosynthesis
MSPTVSIILPTYDRLPLLREAVDSVLAQTVSDWELIVADDGSTDDTVAWLEALGDPRIVVLPHEHTGHRSLLRNNGLAIAKADWIAFLDSDDRWVPQKLERHLAFHAANPRYRWSYTGRRFIDGNGAPIPAERFAAWTPHAGNILRQVLTHQASIALPSVMAERALLREVGGFALASWSAEDYELWLRLAERFECGVLAEPLLEVRKHKSTSFQRPEVDLAFAAMFRAFSARTSNAELAEIARTRSAQHALGAADRLTRHHEWTAAARAVATAMSTRPLRPFVYRAGLRLAWRRLRTVVTRATAPAA